MTEKYTLARPYALAVFSLAKEDGKFDAWLDVLRFLARVTVDSRLAKLVEDPRFSKEKLIGLILDIADGKLLKMGENFIRVLVDANRINVACEILHLFEKEVDVFKGRTRVKITSAYPLTHAYQQIIRMAMAERLRQEVDTCMIVDESLIGGVVIRIGDVVIDMSIRGRLTQLGLDLRPKLR
uniref:ATP synthase subunit delta n=1 Tax=Candidatus Kentrum sp. MB TaxID=2138164 RepID=A0A450XEQ8_9GAMM|nr:MAG: F-type H+-transporting ATPase subunit delta [Candidatus Kentron sp. MB]VFK27719.1 MAG: F-type H+-transporting ATPase subunit delta [Candidatus Kentron sp. MB]VFK74404.1 MAG: F-type H+-transporting ATPase subunit delta [Candidatus Kentron sp. MB]